MHRARRRLAAAEREPGVVVRAGDLPAVVDAGSKRCPGSGNGEGGHLTSPVLDERGDRTLGIEVEADHLGAIVEVDVGGGRGSVDASERGEATVAVDECAGRVGRHLRLPGSGVSHHEPGGERHGRQRTRNGGRGATVDAVNAIHRASREKASTIGC